MGAGIDYTALANRIRGAHRLREARLEREHPAQQAATHKLALGDALDLLQSDAGTALLQTVETALRAQVAEASTLPRPRYAVGDHPNPLKDPFLDGVLDYYRDDWLTPIDGRRLAQAVVTGLAKSASEDGFVDSKNHRLGPLGDSVVQALLSARDSGPSRADSAKNTGKYQGLSRAVLHRVALSQRHDSHLERMPVVADLMRALRGDKVLRGVSMASVQHLFPSSIALYETMFAAGMNPIDAHVGGKFYSANVNTLARMDARGMQLHMSASEQSNAVDAEDDVREMARQELASMFHGVDPKQPRAAKFLLLDDGGKLIEALHTHYPHYAHLCVAVEQTTRGVQVLEKMKANGVEILLPVVNMAGADLKRTVESPLIAASIVWHVERYLGALNLPDKLPRDGHRPTAVVVGFGATGAATAEALARRGYDVVVTDIDASKLEAAAAAGFRALPRAQAFAEADILVGSTGHGALHRSEWGLVKDGAVMVNAASGNHELGIGDLAPHELDALDPSRRESDTGAVSTRFQGKDLAVGRATDDARLEHRVVHTPAADGTRELLFLRAGSVVNMEHDLPPELRQIIVGMLLASSFQAVRTQGVTGLVALDPEVQSFLRARFEKSLAELGLSWQAPDLDAVAGPWG